MHQRTHSGYRPGKYIMPHEHMFPVNGFLSVDVNGSDTLLRSPITGRVFKLGGRAGRMVLFPGGVRHTVPPWPHEEAPGSPRMSVAFNIDWVAAGSKSRCVIPLRMKWCEKYTRTAKHHWATLVAPADAAKLDERGVSALQVDYVALSELGRATTKAVRVDGVASQHSL